MSVTVSQTKELPKLNHVDLLRGVAIILVIICHASQRQTSFSPHLLLVLDFGRIGVQLFFFLSAYTLCLSMKARNDLRSINHFYIRRFFRIAPLYYLGIVIYYLYNSYLNNSMGGPYSFTNVISNVLFAHGLVPSANNSIVPGGWSIGTEMLFYLIFPGIFYLYINIFRSKISKLLAPLAALVIANIFIAVVYLIVGVEASTSFYYYHILTQLPVFILGISYFFLEKEVNIKIPRWLAAILVLGLLAVALVLINIPLMKYSRNIALFIAGVAFVILFDLFKKIKAELSVLKRIGQLSFSIYIFHFIVIFYLTPKLFSLFNVAMNAYLNYVLEVIVTIIITFGIASLSEKLIEKPGIRLGKMFIKKS